MIDPLHDIGTPRVSPRTPGKPGNVPPPNEVGSHDDKDLIIEALAVRVYVESDRWPTFYMKRHGLPETFEDLPSWFRRAILSGSNKSPVKAAAELVRMDRWSDLCQIVEDHLKQEGYNLKDHVDETVNFVEHISATAAAHSKIAEVFEATFQAKGFYKVIRPVSKVIKILGLDQADKVSLLKVLQSYDFPNHYAYPAGHGADAGSTFAAIAAKYDLDEAKLDEIFQVCRVFAHFRTFSLMHLSDENEAGFASGAAA